MNKKTLPFSKLTKKLSQKQVNPNSCYEIPVLRSGWGGEILKSSKSDFFIFEEQQKKIERSKFNKSKCGISFRYSTISFYILSLQTFVCRLYRLKNVEIFAFFCQYMISPPRFSKIGSVLPKLRFVTADVPYDFFD